MSVQGHLVGKGDLKPVAPRVPGNVGAGFDLKNFVENFASLAEAEGGIKRIREMVLVLAVRGALVAQEPSEGSAAGLLPKLDEGRARLSGTSRVRTDLTAVASDEVPFEIPPTWRWIRLGHLGAFVGGGTPSKATSAFWDGPIPWVSPKDMKRAYIDDAVDHISEAAVDGSAAKLIAAGSLLFVVRGMILAHSFPVALTTKTVTINQDMKALILAVPATDEYVLRACWAARLRVLQRVERSSHGTCRLDTEVIEELPIPLPPFEEQTRIVARVDELMEQLDNLEAKQRKTREVQTKLRAAALDALTSADGAKAFDCAWKRVTGSFGVLFERADSVGDLRRAILDLSVMGRLVPSRADDGVAPEFATADEAPHPLPTGWKWSRIEALASHIVDCLHATPRYTTNGFPAIRTADVVPGRVLLDRARLVDEAQFQERLRRLAPLENDILYSREGERLGIAACVPAGVRLCLSQRMMQIRVKPPLFGPFIMWAMNSRFVYRQAVGDTGGSTSPHINIKDVRRFLIPVPPVPQQHRIVARIELLMKLCDDLEGMLQRAEKSAARLVEALVSEMLK